MDNAVFQKERELFTQLIYNDISSNKKVLSTISSNLEKCDAFDFSVAFVSDSGLISLKHDLNLARDRGVRGRIITSTYLAFNNPKMFRILLNTFDKSKHPGSNVEIRIYNKEHSNFHPKGYIFKKNDECKILVGSSNLTQNALSVNQEWNVFFNSFSDEEITNQIKSEFEQQWADSVPLTNDFINAYETIYKKVPHLENNGFEIQDTIKPNEMQVAALESLDDIRKSGKDKALLISATGTGKTYLSAFDVLKTNSKRVLFVVHRENIAKAAMESFGKIMPGKSKGLFTGSKKDKDCDFVFSTVMTIGKKDYYTQFKRDEFDYIIIDEVHRAGAKSYQGIIEYFTPKFFLGMTATPERTDGYDIYKLFDNTIAYEIRLQQALEYDLLCPFHYFGIRDFEIDGVEIDDKSDFNNLTNEARVDHIIEAINEYGYSGDKVHGLIFVSRKEEAVQLSEMFNKKGYRTVALTGSDDEEARERAIDRLEMPECNDALDYIFTVDIFNEGIDIPCVNQVVMVRPTQSAIIFVQQLGRGLRKYKNKEYVVVIDIIGNYTNNYLIPVALSGKNDGNKDGMRKFLYERNSVIKGASTVSFDEVTKKKIFESIDIAKTNSAKVLKSSYELLRNKLGRIPTLFDFDKYNSIDPLLIFSNGTFQNYHSFLLKYEKTYSEFIPDEAIKYLSYVSTKYANGKRPHELLFLKMLLDGFSGDLMKELDAKLRDMYSLSLDECSKISVENQMTQNYLVGSEKDTYAGVIFADATSDGFLINDNFKKHLDDCNSFREKMYETVNYGLHRYECDYNGNLYSDTIFSLYAKYTYADVVRLLSWKKSEVPLNIGGYKFDRFSNTFPVFIDYEESPYSDEFIDNSHLNAMSKKHKKKHSKDMQIIEKADFNGTKIHLFVRKNKSDLQSKEYYYLGTMRKRGEFKEIVTKDGINEVIIPYELDNPVRQDIYDYITKA